MPLPPLPAYGTNSLTDVLPSVLAALGVADEPNALALEPCTNAVVLLIDGLGWSALQSHPDDARFLSSGAGRAITVGCPTTTVASVASLGTGRTPGEHGLTGYTSFVPEIDAVINWLAWQKVGTDTDLRNVIVPEEIQPAPTSLERAVHAGVSVHQVAPASFNGSGLTRAVLRGGTYVGTVASGDVAALTGAMARKASDGRQRLTYCYYSDLDLIGHVHGPDSDAWVTQLRLLDAFVAELASRLPAGATLFVTSDHGMVRVPDRRKIDYDARPDLQEGVHALAGEGRARHVHAVNGAAGSVLERWRSALGDDFWVLSRDEVIDAGLFGPSVGDVARSRIGDVVALARSDGAILRLDREPRLSRLVGHHGSMTSDELFVPLLEFRF